MVETVSTPSGASPTVSSTRLARELRGAVQLVLDGSAVRVVLCNLGGRDVVAALDEVGDLADILPIWTEHDAAGTYSVIVGPLRA
ncbi:MAG: hypothetical protein R6W93_06930 [Candidatus Limnocylindrales bacterium]|jgi:hypothetical protein